MRLLVRVFLVGFILLGLAVISAAAWLVYVYGDVDIFDRVEVLSVNNGSEPELVFIVFKYHHANSSGNFTGIAELPRQQAPAVGSNNIKITRNILAVWSGEPTELVLSPSPERKLQIAFRSSGSPKPAISNIFSDCYFENLSPGPALCFNPARVNLLQSTP